MEALAGTSSKQPPYNEGVKLLVEVTWELLEVLELFEMLAGPALVVLVALKVVLRIAPKPTTRMIAITTMLTTPRETAPRCNV
jgi:hypothetical protein